MKSYICTGKKTLIECHGVEILHQLLISSYNLFKNYDMISGVANLIATCAYQSGIYI